MFDGPQVEIDVLGRDEMRIEPTERLVIEGNDSKTIIVGSGKKALLVAAVDQNADSNKVLAEVGKVAELLKTS